MKDKEEDVPCALCCGNLSLWMSKAEMQGLLETLIERNLTLIEFAQRNHELTSVDKTKRIQEISFQSMQANKLLEQITYESARTTRQQLPVGCLKTEPLPPNSVVKIDTTTFDRPCIKIVIRVPKLGVAYAENAFIEDQDLAKLSDRWQKINEAENRNAHA